MLLENIKHTPSRKACQEDASKLNIENNGYIHKDKMCAMMRNPIGECLDEDIEKFAEKKGTDGNMTFKSFMLICVGTLKWSVLKTKVAEEDHQSTSRMFTLCQPKQTQSNRNRCPRRSSKSWTRTTTNLLTKKNMVALVKAFWKAIPSQMKTLTTQLGMRESQGLKQLHNFLSSTPSTQTVTARSL
jgi:hypothetical protein